MTGLLQEGDIPTTDLTEAIAKAQALVVHELSERVHDVALWGPINGVNTRFELPPRFTGRVLLDAQNNQDEKSSLQVFTRAPSTTGPPIYTAATVASVDALHGQIVLSVAPVSATIDSVRFTGLLIRSAVTKERFRVCVELYAAALAMIRARGPGRVVPSNPRAQSTEKEGVDFMDLYEREVRGLRNTRGSVAAKRTGLPSVGDGFPAPWTW